MQWFCGRFVCSKEAEGRVVTGRGETYHLSGIKHKLHARYMQYGDHLQKMRGLVVGKEHRDDVLDIELVYPAATVNTYFPGRHSLQIEQRGWSTQARSGQCPPIHIGV